MIRLLRISIRLLCLLSLVDPAYSAEKSAPLTNDVRVLIDVSGSMKHNDPQNMRAPALRLLSGLLPSGSRAGVWVFGDQVSNIVPVNDVNESWKTLAHQASNKIHSLAPYTDIEAALKTSSSDWSATDKQFRRSIILLTDGLVDIAKDSTISAQSRLRIQEEVLVALRKNGVTLYTIALSDNADQQLLAHLAVASGGQYEKADTADKLERLFLRIFEQVAKPETLPIVKNQVNVDAAVDEVTFLAFSNRNAEAVRLIAPDGAIIEAEKVPQSVKWHHEEGYDLITVKDPQAGAWKLDAETDPDNRAMIVTNLKLAVTELPNAISIKDKIAFEAQLQQDGQTLNKQEFLRFVRMRFNQIAQPTNIKTNIAVFDDGFDADRAKRDGIYTGLVKDISQAGIFEFILNVDGTTFQRERRQTVTVLDTLAQASLSKNVDDPKRADLLVRPHAALANLDTLTANAIVTTPTGDKGTLQLTKSNGGEWSLAITSANELGVYKVDVNLVGTRANGEPMSEWLDTLTIENAPPPQKAVKKSPLPEKAASPASVKQPPINWLNTGLKVAVLNAVIIPCAFFGYRRWRNKASKQNPGEEISA